MKERKCVEEIDPAKISQDRAFPIRNRQDSGNEEEVTGWTAR
ncbi:hypothetical protein CHCC20333_0272 [Bacillus paralicheniformis]|nr:hypothetical protein CHCC20333_0272 [Bacillus paralicheniformis]